MATFTPAPAEVLDLIAEIIDEFHPDLAEAGARIGAVMARPTLDQDGEPKGPAMAKDGFKTLARIKRNSEEDRAGGKDDATVTIDADHWESLADEPDGRDRQRALIDHELYHLVVQREKALPGTGPGAIRTDDRGRPLFKMRPHDWETSGFLAVAERHGSLAVEVIEAKAWRNQFGQLLFSFASDLDAVHAGK
jgi:Putative phage metallopeptidase